jgi:catechol 2,3-dioxygenase-like lactoylglutathione lyase family enzyme
MLGGAIRPFDVWCLLDAHGAQLEMFQFPATEQAVSPPGAGGYEAITIEVWDARAVREKLAAHTCVDEATGRGFLVRDPDGTRLEVCQGQGPGKSPAPCRLAEVSLRVRHPEASLQFWSQVVGLPRQSASASEPLCLGGDCLRLALLQAQENAPPAPSSSPPPPGILNVAVTASHRAAFESLRARLLASGAPLDFPPISVPGQVEVAYLRDPEGHSLELLYVEEAARQAMGFRRRLSE